MKTTIAAIATLLILLACSASPSRGASGVREAGTRVVYLVRHAEKLEGRDPSLSEAGVERARRLAWVLGDEPLAHVFVTDTNRSRETAAELARAKGIAPLTYAPLDGDALAERVRGLENAGGCLVVAHSNTVPIILKALGGPARGDLDEDEYDLLYAIVLRDGAFVRALSLRY